MSPGSNSATAQATDRPLAHATRHVAALAWRASELEGVMTAAMATPALASAPKLLRFFGRNEEPTSTPAVVPKGLRGMRRRDPDRTDGHRHRAPEGGSGRWRVRSSSRRAATRADEAPPAAIHIPLPPRDMPSHTSRSVIVLPPLHHAPSISPSERFSARRCGLVLHYGLQPPGRRLLLLPSRRRHPRHSCRGKPVERVRLRHLGVAAVRTVSSTYRRAAPALATPARLTQEDCAEMRDCWAGMASPTIRPVRASGDWVATARLAGTECACYTSLRNWTRKRGMVAREEAEHGGFERGLQPAAATILRMATFAAAEARFWMRVSCEFDGHAGGPAGARSTRPRRLVVTSMPQWGPGLRRTRPGIAEQQTTKCGWRCSMDDQRDPQAGDATDPAGWGHPPDATRPAIAAPCQWPAARAGPIW